MSSTVAPAPTLGRSAHRSLFATVACSILALDQLSKEWALRALDDRVIDLVWTLRFRLTFNQGMAFGLGAGFPTLVALAALAVSAVVLYAGLRARSRWWAVGLGLVLGGAAGNLFDRATRGDAGLLSGRVVDFIDFQFWPVFNVADMAISLGALALIVTSFREEGTKRGDP